MGLGDAFEMAYQEVVQPLSGRIVIDLDQPYCGRGRAQGTVLRRFALYNVFHLCRAIYKWLIRMEFSPYSHFPRTGRSMPSGVMYAKQQEKMACEVRRCIGCG
jgi:hypothetical protein